MPIRELSRRLGVSPDLLRKWERRYGLLRPGRTTGNQRLYSRVDEARARVMLRHVRDGMPAAQAAELAIATPFRLEPRGQGTEADESAADAQADMQAALERYDETAAEHALEKLFATLSATAVIRDVFLPYLHEIGEKWADKHLSVAQEHFASAFIHSRLMTLARGWDRGLGQRALLACPSGEQHTLGLIAFGIALHEIGWRITYLGADTPLEMVGQAAAAIRPEAIILSASLPGRLADVTADLRELAKHAPLALGGAGTGAALADRCGATHLSTDPVSAAAAFFG